MNISEYIDYTILRPDATREDVIQVIEEAKEKHFATVCVNQYRTRMCVEMLRNTGVKVCTVIGFTLGAVTTEVKVNETICAIKSGSDEIDMVMNILRKNFAEFLRKSQIKLEITGFDMDGFQQAVRQRSKCRLRMIEDIVFTDDDIASDAEKVESIKLLFQREFFDED